MKKIEMIWREVLFQAIEKKNRKFEQKELAHKFGFSTSTVFQALKIPRIMGAVRVTGRFFVLEDPEKLLYYWATIRNFKKDLLWEVKIDLPIAEIEAQMPPEIILGGYTACKDIFEIQPADYNHVYVYTQNLKLIKNRYVTAVKDKSWPNLTILKADRFLKDYGEITCLAQTFVDLWNLSDWQAKEYTRVLKEKIDELLLS